LAIGEGLRLTFATEVSSSGRNVLNITGGLTSKTHEGTSSQVAINLNKKDVEAIARLTNVAAISPKYVFFRDILYKKEIINKEIRAVESNYLDIHENTVKFGGRFISPLDIKQKKAVIVLGTKTAEDFFPKGQNPVGQYVNIGNKPFLIIGAMQHKPQIVSHESPDEFSNWIPISTYELFINPAEIDSIDIVYSDALLLPVLKQQIQETVALIHSADSRDTSVVEFADYAKQQKKINIFFEGMQVFLGAIGALTLLIAGIGIANVMYASINRATHEIGIRMALGARTFHIIIHYVFEALVATFAGGIIGLVLASILVYVLRSIALKGQLIDIIGQPKPVLSLLVIFIVVSVLGVVGVLVGLFPALKAAKVDPTEALFYE
jgi:putative ABC transport system permease protein